MDNQAHKQIYLTIDDSPSKDYRANLDYLISKDIPCVFFCIGHKMKAAWGDLKYAVRKGYIIGNHSFSHPCFSDLSLEKAKAEILQTDLLINKLYKECGIKQYPKFFRFPYGDKGDGKYGLVFESYKTARWRNFKHNWRTLFTSNSKRSKIHAQAIQAYLAELGYQSASLLNINYPFFEPLQKDIDWSWTFDIEEWRYKNESLTQFLPQIKQRLHDSKPQDCRGKQVDSGNLTNFLTTDLVLFHDRDETQQLFKPIVELLLNMNIRFLSMPYEIN